MTPRAGQLQAPTPAGPVLLRWVEWGPVQGRPVLCLHGLTRNGRDFDALAMDLAGQGRRVVCPDMPGRGMSGWLPDGMAYAVPTYLAVLAPLLEALRQVDVVGTSMGGLIAMGQCTVPGVRIRRLVLNDVGPFLSAEGTQRLRDHLVHAPGEFADIAEYEAHLRKANAGFGALTDSQWAAMALHGARMTGSGRVVPHFDPAIFAPMMTRATLPNVDLWPIWPMVAQRPVLVLRGAMSELLTPAVAARMAQSPGVRLETIPGCGHAPALMDPGQIALVRNFLSD
ncbi:MAG TPA: alpha/beta hydrolase [Roseococcus sp.]|nr:alpha/beta hydrolase [Roseococcus sp.]